MNKRTGFFLLLLLVATAAAFAPSLRNGFTGWDDPVYVTANPRIRSLAPTNIFRLLTSTHYGLYEGLTELSFAVEYHFFGLDPRVYHTTNLVLHLANTLLVFYLLSLLSRSGAVALAGALLFGLHPLRVESVAWISERKDVLYGFLILLSAICYLRYRRDRVKAWYYWAIVCFFLSFLPKPQGILFPLVFLLFDYLHRRPLDRRAIGEKWPFILISLSFLAATIVSQTGTGGISSSLLLGAAARAPAVCYGLTLYLFKLLLPINLSPFYPEPRQLAATGRFAFPLLLLPALALLIIYSHRYSRKAVFAGLFFLVNIVLVLQVIPTMHTIAADRYTYIPAIGISYLAGEGFRLLLGGGYRRPRLARLLLVSCAVIVAGLFTVLSRAQCRVWENTVTLWSAALRQYPGSAIIHNNLGTGYEVAGELVLARRHFETAATLDLGYALARVNLGVIAGREGDPAAAREYYLEACQIDPFSAPAHKALAAWYIEEERWADAERLLRAALEKWPTSEWVRIELSSLREREGDWDAARELIEEGIRLRPHQAQLHNALGYIYYQLDQIAPAVEEFKRALRLDSDYPRAVFNLTAAYLRQGDYASARKWQQKLERLDRELADQLRPHLAAKDQP